MSKTAEKELYWDSEKQLGILDTREDLQTRGQSLCSWLSWISKGSKEDVGLISIWMESLLSSDLVSFNANKQLGVYRYEN